MDQQIRTKGKLVYRSSLGKLNLACIEKEILLESAFCQSRFARDFYLAERNMAIVSSIGPLFSPPEVIVAAEQVIESGAEKMLKQVQTIEKRLEAAAKGAGIKDPAKFQLPYQYNAEIYHPLGNLHLAMLETIDRCIRLAESLRLHREISSDEFKKVILNLRGKHTGFMSFTRQAYTSVIRASKRRNQKAGEVLENANAAADSAVANSSGDNTKVSGPEFSDEAVAMINEATAALQSTPLTDEAAEAVEQELSPSAMVDAQRAEEQRIAAEAAAQGTDLAKKVRAVRKKAAEAGVEAD